MNGHPVKGVSQSLMYGYKLARGETTEIPARVHASFIESNHYLVYQGFLSTHFSAQRCSQV